MGQSGGHAKSQELTGIEGTDQAGERDNNQHLLIASGVPRERSMGVRRDGKITVSYTRQRLRTISHFLLQE